jgi:transposase-like protein
MYHQNRSEEFIKSVVQKMCMPGGKSVVALSREIGVCEQTLYNWRKMIQNKVTEVSKERSPRGWNLSSKYQAVIDSATKSGEELGIWLRKNGLQTAHIELWQKECKSMLVHNVYKEENKALKLRNSELEKEINRKDKTIAEVTSLLVLKKKAKALGLIVED